MTYEEHPLVRKYLDDLETELAPLPPGERREIVDGVREHIASAATAGSLETESDVRDLLAQLGDPRRIASDAGISGASEAARLGWKEPVGIVLLLLGGPFVGWLLGAALVWPSRLWTRSEKVLGALLIPWAFLLALVLLGVGGDDCSGSNQRARHLDSCSDPQTIDYALVIGGLTIVACVSLAVSAFLLWQASRRSGRVEKNSGIPFDPRGTRTSARVRAFMLAMPLLTVLATVALVWVAVTAR